MSSPTETNRLSVIIIAKNEADRIARCLESVAGLADEIIVLDSGSTDGTVDIAKQYTPLVFETDWPGYGRQKQRALDKTQYDWVLSLDADEALTPALRDEIADLLATQPTCSAYAMRWRAVVLGKHLNYGGTSRYVLRLFNKQQARFSDWIVREKVVLPDGGKVGRLKGRLLHYSIRDFDQLMQKNMHYASLMAQRKYEAGKHGWGLIGASLRACFVFIQLYIFRLGILDGGVGYMLAVMHSQYTFNKYAGLWYRNRAAKLKK